MEKTFEKIIQKALNFVKEKLGNEKTGHDFWHAYRVWKLAKFIAEKEGIKNTFRIELAAILHDIADRKTFGEEEGMRMIREFLNEQGVKAEDIEKICEIITNISFSKGKIPATLEGKIVQDADRIDALGAIGIARCFAGGALFNRVIYNPENVESTSIGHFYEKLLKLKDFMHTKTAKQIAEKRHNFMEKFLKEFFAEWDIEDLEKNDFENGKFYIWKEKFAICKVKDIENLPEDFFALIMDKNEITLVVEESQIPSNTLEVEKGWKIITFNMFLPFELVGFIARISSALAQEGISIFVISSYSTDHILIKEKDLEKTINVLEKLGFEMLQNNF